MLPPKHPHPQSETQRNRLEPSHRTGRKPICRGLAQIFAELAHKTSSILRAGSLSTPRIKKSFRHPASIPPAARYATRSQLSRKFRRSETVCGHARRTGRRSVHDRPQMAGLLLVAYGPSALPRTGWAGVPSERAIFFIPRKRLISRPVEQGFNERFENNLPQKFTSTALCGCSGPYGVMVLY